MRFHLSEEQEMFSAALSRFAGDACDGGLRRAAFESETAAVPEFWRGLSDLGVAGILVPEALGGLGLATVDLAVVAEVLGHAGAPGPFLGHQLCIAALLNGGSEAQKAEWLPALAEGRLVGTVAITGEAGGWAPENWTARESDGRITARFTNVLAAAEADLIAVGLAGGRFGLIEAKDPGLALRPFYCVDRSRRLWDMTLSEASITVLPEPAGAAVCGLGQILLAADACGGANRLLAMLTDYVQIRRQFNRPLSDFQGIRHRLADMAVRVEPLRPLAWLAACAPGSLPQEAARLVPLAKAHAAETFMAVGRNAIEGHGGIGYTWEHDAQIWLKRAMFDYAYLGTPQDLRAEAARLAEWAA